MKQKHFMDIENLREESTEFRQSNADGFEVGDIISIQEKIDGSSACARYDVETDSLIAFSRKMELSFDKTLQGFWNYVQTLDKTPFKAHPNYYVFGEWNGTNKIKYKPEYMKVWIVYDIYDAKTETWQTQDVVKNFCEEANLPYIHVFYEGPFISWVHCRQFMNQPAYGDIQEGCIVKNMSKLSDEESRLPFYLKLVNESFKESMKPRIKEVNPEEEQAKENAMELCRSIVTRNRVEKELYKMRDEGLVPDKLTPQDMKDIAKLLPKRIFEDCMKEEKEIVMACGQYFGKCCGSLTMKFAREIICGE